MNECPICFNDFASSLKPYMLNCGHLYCLPCLKLMCKDSESHDTKQISGKIPLVCYICKQSHYVSSFESIQNEVVVNTSSLASPWEESKLNMTLTSEVDFGNEQDQLNIDLEPGFQCGAHGEVLHSYIISNKVLLCNTCIEEKGLDKEKYRPIPQVIKHIHRSLTDQKYSKQLCLIQMDSFKQALKLQLETQKDKCRTKIEMYFKELHEIIRKSELKCYEQLDNMHSKIVEKASVDNDLEKIRERIEKHDAKLDKFLEMSDSELVSKYQKVKKIANHSNKYFKNMRFPENSVNFTGKRSMIKRIEELVSNSVDLSQVKNEGKKMKNMAKKCFDLKDKWFCNKCLHQNSNKKHQIECKRCQAFRPIKSYHSCFRNRSELNSDEMENLMKRRDFEHRKVQELSQHLPSDSQEEEKQNCTPKGDDYQYLYCVDNDWYSHWQLFISNDSSTSAYKSAVKGVGIIEPGPIDNRNLLTETGEIAPNLVIGEDYTVLEEPVWHFLWSHYGGGPVIKRCEFDIYSEPIDATYEVQEYYANLQKIKETPNKHIEKLNTLRKNSERHEKIKMDLSIDFDQLPSRHRSGSLQFESDDDEDEENLQLDDDEPNMSTFRPSRSTTMTPQKFNIKKPMKKTIRFFKKNIKGFGKLFRDK